MAQSVYNIPDSSGVDFLTNINAVLGAIQTINSGATPPTDTQAGMWWGDISDPNTFYLKMRNHTNDGWVSLYAYDVATKTIRALSNNKYLAEITGTTGAVFLPSGTTTQRPTLTSSERGLRYNTDNDELEFWDGAAWDSVGGDLNINSLTGKTKPDDTDNMALQESGGLLKKLSWSNLKTTAFASPALTGTPTAPTAAAGTSTTQIATTAFVQTVVGGTWIANDSRAKTALNASGTAPIYACRAWVNFNGTGTVAILASGNVSSITDDGVGIYTVNFTTALSDTKYSITTWSRNELDDNYPRILHTNNSYPKTVSSIKLLNATGNAGAAKDSSELNVAIFR